MRTPLRALPLTLTVLLLLPGCDAEEDGGTAPSLESLTLSAEDATIGSTSTIQGMLTFTDADGDLESAEIDVTDPGGNTSSVSTPITGVSGTREGTVVVQLSLVPPEAGTYEARVILHDAEGNASEPETATFEVTE